MKYFKINLNEILKILLLGKESLSPPREHITRYTQEYIMYVVTAGELRLLLDDKTLTLVPGDICVFDKGVYQTPEKSTFCEYFFIHFLQDSITTSNISNEEYHDILKNKKNNFLNAKLYSTEFYNDLFVYVAEHYHISDKTTFEHFINILKSNVLTYRRKSPEMLLNVSNSIQNFFLKLEQTTEAKKSKSYFHAESIAKYIDEHFREPISAKTIEEKFFINFDYANRIFEEVMKCSIIRYRNLTRLNYAKLLLSTTATDISQISTDSGFDDISYFSRLFKKYEGLTPSEYRKKYLWGK